jgi:hypothetical protein
VENAATDFLPGRCRSDFWDMRIAADAVDLNCSEWPANMRKDDLDLSDNGCACRFTGVLLAGIDFFLFCLGRKKQPRKRQQLQEIRQRDLNGMVRFPPALESHNI